MIDKKKMKAFASRSIGDLVSIGLVEPYEVRLWIRSTKPGRLIVYWWPEELVSRSNQLFVDIHPSNDTDNTATVQVGPGLTPAARYGYRVTRDDDQHVLGEGVFETAPAHPDETPARFSIALMSCNQPFNKDGSVNEISLQMLRAALKCLKNHAVKMIFMVGDQIYTDYPIPISLFKEPFFQEVAPQGRTNIYDCTQEEIRRLYQQRYRIGWSIPEWQELLSTYPCYMMWDDHEIVNNWGSESEHEEPSRIPLFAGARQAFIDYQVSRTLLDVSPSSKSLHYSITFGAFAAFVMDLRSTRRPQQDSKVITDAQWAALDDFLASHSHLPVLAFALSVPIAHLPGGLASLMMKLGYRAGDFADRWSSPFVEADRQRFFETLNRHQFTFPKQRIVFLSGDIHLGCVLRLAWPNNITQYQFTSSAITNVASSALQQALSKSLIYLNRKIRIQGLNARVRRLNNVSRIKSNPYGKLNLGILDIVPGESYGLQFNLYGHQGEDFQCVFRSAQL